MRINPTTVHADVLVIGGGGSAARAAIAADEGGAQVYMIVKGLFGHSGCTPVALGGFNAAFGFTDARDNWEVHLRDTVLGGGLMNNQRLAEILCKQSPERFKELEMWGSLFDRNQDGDYFQRQLGGHKYPRTCISGDRTGGEMMRGLVNECYRRDIEILEDVMATSLLVQEGQVVGCTALDMKNGRFLVFNTKAIVLACGGSGQIYKYCFAPYGKTGDGLRMAYETGAEIVDIEFFQFHPTGYISPQALAGQSISEGVRGEGGHLYNTRGERFMKRYDPDKLELGTRDYVSRCIYAEVKEGRGTEAGGVYLSVNHLPDHIVEERLPTMLARGLNYGVDIRREPMETAPSSHYQCGGVSINEEGETTLSGLFAAGEVAGGVQGGNRLGANSLPDLLVFGKIAGESAARRARGSVSERVSPAGFKEEVEKAQSWAYDIVTRDNGENPIALRNEIKDLMWNNVGLARTESGLKQAIASFEQMRERRLPFVGSQGAGKYSTEWIEAIGVRGMVATGEMMARAALMRTESRAGHYREDYPALDSNWCCNIVIEKKGQEMTLKTSPVVWTRLDPAKVELPQFPVPKA